MLDPSTDVRFLIRRQRAGLQDFQDGSRSGFSLVARLEDGGLARFGDGLEDVVGWR
jgi:hypothetical protein